MPGKVDDADDGPAISLIALDEAGSIQLLEQGVRIDVFVREDLGTNATRAVLEAPFSVGTTPDADEGKASVRGEIG